METLENDIVSLFEKRAYDIAALTANKKVKVSLNGKRLEVKNFSNYVDMYLKGREDFAELPKVLEEPSPRWEVICTLSDGSFTQVSFVNSICTTKGGTHVEYIASQIVAEVLKKV
jgi:DNA topoisomerase-2